MGMFKVRLIIYVVVLVVLVFCLKRILSTGLVNGDKVAVPALSDEGQGNHPKETLLAQHMTLGEFLGGNEGEFRFKIVKYLQYDSRGGKGAGIQSEMSFSFSEGEEGKEECEGLSAGELVLLCWSEIEVEESGISERGETNSEGKGRSQTDKRKAIRVNVLKALTQEEARAEVGALGR